MSLPSRPSGAFSSWEIGLALRYLRAKRKEGGVATIAVISFIGIMLAVAVLMKLGMKLRLLIAKLNTSKKLSLMVH